MKKAFMFLSLMLMTLVMSAVAFAVEDPTVVVVGMDEFVQMLLKSVGEIKGASGLVIAVIVTQLMMKAFQTPIANMAGKYRLLIVVVLSLITGVLAMVASGVSAPAALLHSSTIAGLQVLIHQIYKQFIEKKDEAKPAVAAS